MCVIVYKPVGATINMSIVDRWWEEYHDFCGGMCFHDGQSHVTHTKELSDLKHWMKEHGLFNTSSEGVIHLRYATSGAINLHNTHPFDAGDYYLMHNGQLHGAGNCEECDTIILARAIASGGVDMFNPYMQAIFCESRFVLMHKQTGKISLINENSGLWHKGLWYSKKVGTLVDMPKLIAEGAI